MLVGLFLHVGIGFADDSNWIPTGPTEEDIMAATAVERPAVKGSSEEALIKAATEGDLKKIATLITAGTDLEARDNQNRTALMRAAEKGHSEVARALLNAGANVMTKDNYGWTAFFIAADRNRVEIVKMLVDRGADSDKNFNDVFVSSVFKGNTNMVKALGNNISCKTIREASSVLKYGNTEMVEIINDLMSKCDKI